MHNFGHVQLGLGVTRVLMEYEGRFGRPSSSGKRAITEWQVTMFTTPACPCCNVAVTQPPLLYQKACLLKSGMTSRMSLPWTVVEVVLLLHLQTSAME